MANQAAAGKAPITFSDSLGAQRAVPLSAFTFNGSTIALNSTWTSVFTAQDQAILLALANAKVTAGELTPPPVIPPQPAIIFTAAVAGPQGNGITVTVTADPPPLATAQLLITATETDTYSGLADATAAENQIGVDAAVVGGPPVGTGVVMLKSGAATAAGLPKDGQSLKVKTATTVLAADGSTTLFTLVPRAGYGGPGIPVTVNLDPSGTTFTLTASYDANNTSTKVSAENGLGSLPASVAFLIAAQAPPRGLDLPAVGPSSIALSGGSAGIPATGIAYTS